MTTRRSAQRKTRSIAVLIASILLIIGLIAVIAVSRGSGSRDFTGEGNGVEEIVQIPEG